MSGKYYFISCQLYSCENRQMAILKCAESKVNSSFNSFSEVKRTISEAETISNISVGGPLNRKPETTTLVSRTTFTAAYSLFRFWRLTSWTISQISSKVIGARFEGVKARRLRSGFLTCLRIISSSDWNRSKCLPFFRKGPQDFGSISDPSGATSTAIIKPPSESYENPRKIIHGPINTYEKYYDLNNYTSGNYITL